MTQIIYMLYYIKIENGYFNNISQYYSFFNKYMQPWLLLETSLKIIITKKSYRPKTIVNMCLNRNSWWMYIFWDIISVKEINDNNIAFK